MKIAIDCRSLSKKPAGVPNFLIAFINELSAQAEGMQIYLFSNSIFHPQVTDRLRLNSNVVRVTETFLPFQKIAIAWYLIKVPFLINKLNVDVFYTPIPNLPIWLPKRTRTCITVLCQI
jgi:hypothetical protein